MADLDALRARWLPALLSARASARTDDSGAVVPQRYADHLIERWQEPHRRYHTLTHLTAVLDRVDVLESHAEDADLVRLAAWFHDAVYLPDRSTNEERSARLAERALAEAGVPERGVAEVARLVRLTQGHDPADGDRNGEVLCDADLAILASAPDTYTAYTAAVREEYHFIPEDAFRSGRADTLRQLLAMSRLFRTEYGREHWEADARRNIAAELDLLTG